MASIRLPVLIIWGIIFKFDSIPVVAWLLLLPMLWQDYYDSKRAELINHMVSAVKILIKKDLGKDTPGTEIFSGTLDELPEELRKRIEDIMKKKGFGDIPGRDKSGMN